MSDALTVRHYHVIVDAPPEAVFDFIADPDNLPRWAIHFTKAGTRRVAGGTMVTTPGGELYFATTGDRTLGVIDWWAGPSRERLERWPTRVVTLPDGRSLYAVTAVLRDPVPANLDQMFDDELATLKQLVEAKETVAA